MTIQEIQPDELADSLGITIAEQKLRTANGLWVPDQRLILLKPGLTRIDRRCVLTHELVHAMAGHGPDAGLLMPEERWTRQHTAKILVDADLLSDLMEWKPDHPEAWCHELRVNPAVLRDWLSSHSTGSPDGEC